MVCRLAGIGSDNGLSPGRRRAIVWTNAGTLLIWPLGTNVSVSPNEFIVCRSIHPSCNFHFIWRSISEILPVWLLTSTTLAIFFLSYWGWNKWLQLWRRYFGIHSLNIYFTYGKWKHFPRYWPLVKGIHRSVDSPHKGQWRKALIFSLICAWTNEWAKKCRWF